MMLLHGDMTIRVYGGATAVIRLYDHMTVCDCVTIRLLLYGDTSTATRRYDYRTIRLCDCMTV